MTQEFEIQNILEQSRRNNASMNITGVLLACNGSIIQVLEGEKEDITFLYNKIQRDPRHTQMILLYEGQTEGRSFDSWAMGYITASSRSMHDLIDQLSFIKNPHLPVSGTNKVIGLLQTFYKNNHRN